MSYAIRYYEIGTYTHINNYGAWIPEAKTLEQYIKDDENNCLKGDHLHEFIPGDYK